MVLSKDLFLTVGDDDVVPLNHGNVMVLEVTHTCPSRVRNAKLTLAFGVNVPESLANSPRAAGNTLEGYVSPISGVTPASRYAAPPEGYRSPGDLEAAARRMAAQAEAEEATHRLEDAQADSAGVATASRKTAPNTQTPAVPAPAVPAPAVPAGTPDTVTPAGLTQFNVKPSTLGEAISSHIIEKCVQLQSTEVAYKRADLTILTVLDPVVLNRDMSATSLDFGRSGAVSLPKYRYKCGSGLTGKLPNVGEVNHKVVGYNLYGANLDEFMDKPGRFLVSGTPFRSYPQLLATPAVGALEKALEKALQTNITMTVGGTNITLIPIVAIGRRWRKVVISQLEGLRAVAGSRGK